MGVSRLVKGKTVYYRGLREIGDRLGVGANTVPRLHRDFALPIYLDFNEKPGATWTWVVSEPALANWELWKSRTDRAYVAILDAIGDTSSHRAGAPGHAKQHYLRTITKYRQLLVEKAEKKSNGRSHRSQGSASLTKDDVDVDLDLAAPFAAPSHNLPDEPVT